MRPEAFVDFNAQTIDDIVAQTRYPVENKAALLEDLLTCYGKYKVLISAGTYKRHQLRWRRIRKHIDSLVNLIEADNADLGTVRELSGGAADVFVRHLRTLAFELSLRDMEPGEFVKKNRERRNLIGLSALQKLTGEWLPEVYERHFKRKAGASRPIEGGPPEGPYIRFAMAVLAAWKIDYAPDSIDDALRRAEKKTEKSPF
jgi:hypothetical protein